MNIEDLIITIFCRIDDTLKSITKGKKMRTRGPEPTISSAEVLTIEVVGEFLGFDCDKHIWAYFKDCWREYFPGLGDRTTFSRHAASLWYWKERLVKSLAADLDAFADDVHIIDGIPIPVVAFKRAHFAKNFKGEAAFGYCAAKGQTYYGFKGHLVVSRAGVVTDFAFAPANADESDAVQELTQNLTGTLLGDKGYIRPELERDLSRRNLILETPVRANMHEFRPKISLNGISAVRRRIETVIGQLAGRFNIEKVWARDTWHLASRLWRKLLAHTLGVMIDCERGRMPLQMEGLGV